MPYISIAHKLACKSAKSNTFKIEMALDCLNNLVDEGVEFPEAISKTLQSFAVSQQALSDAYDNQ